MTYTLGVLLIAALTGALILHLYDLLLRGPESARLLPALLGVSGAYIGLGYDDELPGWGESLAHMFAGVFLAMVFVAALQLLQVRRDAAMTQVLGRRR